MQKFTVFTIIISLTVLMALGDMIAHDYLQNNVAGVPAHAEDATPQVQALVPQGSQNAEVTTELVAPTADSQDALPDLVPVKTAWLGDQPETFELSGIVSPVLKVASYSGLLFDLIPFETSAGGVLKSWNLFEDERYIGNVTQIQFDTDTAAFQAYLQVRQSAQAEAAMGSVNEANNAGDASFYFNHLVKTKTVHRVVLKENTIYVLMYAYSDHEKLKNLFDFL